MQANKYGIEKTARRAIDDLIDIDLSELEVMFHSYKVRVDKMADAAQTHEVTDDATAATANEMINQTAGIRIALEKWRKEQVAPTNKWNKAINAPCKDLRTVLERIEKNLGRKLGAHLAEKKRIQEEEQRKMEEAMAAKPQLEPGATEVSFVAPPQRVETELGTTRLKTEKDWRVVNPAEACAAAWDTRYKQITKAIKPWVNGLIDDGFEIIPGIEVIDVPVAKTSRKR